MMQYPKEIQRWGCFEAVLPGPREGNPFLEQTVTGRFTSKNESVAVEGFYDGDGTYRVRFMPSFSEEYSFTVKASFTREPLSGSFLALPAGEGNQGPVRTQGYHFAYEDGTPYYSVGTTCYVWALQKEELHQQTLQELRKGFFNKLRFCVFPKHYLYNLHEPISYPYEGTPCAFQGDSTGNFQSLMGVQPGNDWDFTRFNPVHFQNIERAIGELCELNIQADLIVMHPYDRWGFSQMTAEQDALYWNYVVARFSAYRNVWWSLANEYDLLRRKTTKDWESYAAILCENDPYNHLRSIHNCGPMYDYTRPWITHCSIQRIDIYKCAELVDQFRARYGKPIVLDEISYEGNIDQGWGNISAQELVRRFWEATVRGGYAGHGETYVHPEDILWWSHGGELHGDSPERIRFLHDQVLTKLPGFGLKPVDMIWDAAVATIDAIAPSGFYLMYFGFFRPSSRKLHLDDDSSWRVELIDTWNMAVEEMGIHKGNFTIPMPGREYMALRITRI